VGTEVDCPKCGAVPGEMCRALQHGYDCIKSCAIPPRQPFTDAPKAPALKTQVGGSHYTDMPIQPMTYSMVNKLDACQHTIIKYVSRFRDKNGIEDLEKAKHCIDLLIEFEREAAKA
jgi:hypothetical protein